MGFFKDLIDRKSTLSSVRFCMVFSFLFVTITPFIVWASVCIYTWKIEDIPSGVITFASVILGIITTGKATEKISENNKPEKKDGI
jgi:hypothetical protein